MAEPFSDELYQRALHLIRRGWTVNLIADTLFHEFGVSPSNTTLYKWKKSDEVKRGIRCPNCHAKDWLNTWLCLTCGYDSNTGFPPDPRKARFDHPEVRPGAEQRW
jgi:hypothetical protein